MLYLCNYHTNKRAVLLWGKNTGSETFLCGPFYKMTIKLSISVIPTHFYPASFKACLIREKKTADTSTANNPPLLQKRAGQVSAMGLLFRNRPSV
jgi:hypothetical protein